MIAPRSSRPWRVLPAAAASALLALLALLACPAPEASALLPVAVVAVQEDWSLRINDPGPNTGSPQVSTQMAASANAPLFFLLHLNSTQVGTSRAGGLELEAWRNTTFLAASPNPNQTTLSTPNELVTWTQVLSRGTTKLTFSVAAASSSTWGDFSYGWASVSATSLTTTDLTLDNYTPDYSVRNSGITYGANRVDSLTLVRVRKYYLDGSVTTDSTPRVVYTQPSGDN